MNLGRFYALSHVEYCCNFRSPDIGIHENVRSIVAFCSLATPATSKREKRTVLGPPLRTNREANLLRLMLAPAVDYGPALASVGMKSAGLDCVCLCHVSSLAPGALERIRKKRTVLGPPLLYARINENGAIGALCQEI
jgi:hypothetical protein